jgi:kynurenine formamidase
VTSGHSGTDIDALGHLSRNGCLHEIARLRRRRVIFVALPLRLVGSTGAPIRPIAIA